MKKIIIAIVCSVLSVSAANAQAPTVQDCLGAITICQNVYTQNSSYFGMGNYPNEIPWSGCLSLGGESNSVWYIFTVQTSGMFNFVLTPNGNDDYDWAVFNMTNASCSDLYSNFYSMLVSCNSSGNTGATGISSAMGGVGNSNGQGTISNKYNEDLPVQAGETYVIMISNWSNGSSGYTLDFISSTAKILGNPACNYLTSFSGCVFNDLNNNGIKDSGENGIPNKLIKSNISNWIFSSDANGNYNAYSYLPKDSISLVNPYMCLSVNPQSYVVTASDTGKNFAVYFIPGVQDLQIVITNLTFARPGFDDVINITYTNAGSAVMDGNVTLDFDNNLTFVSSVPPQSGINGNTLTWDFTNLQPQESRSINVTFNIPASVPLNTIISFTGTINPVSGDTVQRDNYSSIEQTVIGSCDPNYKEVIPDDGLTLKDLTNGEKLIYTIHFQNTGTDTAFKIKITDTLSPNVDASTFELLASSHPCTFNMKEAGIIDFVFNNIQLPDSNKNFTGSNGFVKYAVKPLSTLPVGDSVTNTAYIYFDFNQAVQTNTVSSLIYTTIGIEEGKTDGNGIYIYPNPASSTLGIGLGVMSKGGLCRIYDIMGTEVFNKTFSGNKTQLDVSNLAKGLYLLKVENGDEVMVRRFIKE